MLIVVPLLTVLFGVLPTEPLLAPATRAPATESKLAARSSESTAGDLVAREKTSPDPWSQWRGPWRDGRVRESLPNDLSNLEPLWRIELGKSYSGPIVTDAQVFVTETIDDRLEQVRALDRRTGSERWRVSWPADIDVPFFARANGDWIRATPAWDGVSLYVAGIEEVLVKLDGETGKEMWRVDFPQRYGTPRPDFGFASSPLVTGDGVYVQAASSVVKLDRETGGTLWRSLEGDTSIMSGGAFSSPTRASIAGLEQIVVQTREELAGLDPESGRVLWRREIPNFRGMNILTPLVLGDSVFTSSYRNGTYLIDVDREGDSWSTELAWDHKAHGYMSSPLLVDGLVYLHLGNGRLTVVDPATGESSWTSKPFGKYWSMVHDGRRILALDEGGELLLIDASVDGLELLDRLEIAEQPTWGHLAVRGGELFVRELEAIAAYRWAVPSPAVGSLPTED